MSDILTPARKSRIVKIGDRSIGGGQRPLVQSMNNTDTRDAAATLAQIEALAERGCEITRVAVPDQEAAAALKQIMPASPIPVVADIHFDYRLALAAIENGASAIRINPGNIGGRDRIKAVVDACKARALPIRVGVNSGSLARPVLERFGGVSAEALVTSALEMVKMLEDEDFADIVVSLKASSPALTIAVYRELAGRCDYPLHLGVTEAGTAQAGSVRSAVGIGTLLAEGIGDTIRVSLTGDPLTEVDVGWQILSALDLGSLGPQLISCPTCGRTEVDLEPVAAEIEERLKSIRHPLKVAVMGCAVNGPGEAREADCGIAGGKGFYILFKKGEILRKVPEAEAVDALMALVRDMAQEA